MIFIVTVSVTQGCDISTSVSLSLFSNLLIIAHYLESGHLIDDDDDDEYGRR